MRKVTIFVLDTFELQYGIHWLVKQILAFQIDQDESHMFRPRFQLNRLTKYITRIFVLVILKICASFCNFWYEMVQKGLKNIAISILKNCTHLQILPMPCPKHAEDIKTDLLYSQPLLEYSNCRLSAILVRNWAVYQSASELFKNAFQTWLTFWSILWWTIWIQPPKQSSNLVVQVLLQWRINLEVNKVDIGWAQSLWIGTAIFHPFCENKNQNKMTIGMYWLGN